MLLNRILLLTIFLNILIAAFAYTSSIKWFTKQLGQKKIIECNNVTYWKIFVEKAKKEHPSANNEELAKFITFDIMANSTHPMYATAEFCDKLSNSSSLDYYGEFNGNYFELFNFYTSPKIMLCKIDNNLNLWIALREEQIPKNKNSILQKTETFFSKLWWNKERRDNIFPNKEIFKYFLSTKTEQSCDNFPKILAIIQKMDNMTIHTSEEWVRLCNEQLKLVLKPLMSHVLRGNISGQEVSFVGEGHEKLSDGKHCHFFPDDPRCISCRLSKNDIDIFISYYEN